jgi:hypothetical protein
MVVQFDRWVQADYEDASAARDRSALAPKSNKNYEIAKDSVSSRGYRVNVPNLRRAKNQREGVITKSNSDGGPKGGKRVYRSGVRIGESSLPCS